MSKPWSCTEHLQLDQVALPAGPIHHHTYLIIFLFHIYECISIEAITVYQSLSMYCESLSFCWSIRPSTMLLAGTLWFPLGPPPPEARHTWNMPSHYGKHREINRTGALKELYRFIHTDNSDTPSEILRTASGTVFLLKELSNMLWSSGTWWCVLESTMALL